MAINLTEALGITAADHDLRQKWGRFSEQDGEYVRESASYLKEHAEKIAKEFYDHSFQFPEFQQKIAEAGSSRGVLEGAQKGYFEGMLAGSPDLAYFNGRLNVGSVHAKLNIEPRWNVPNYGLYADLIFPYIVNELAASMSEIERERLTRTLTAWAKLLFVDAALVVEAYISEGVLTRLVEVTYALMEASEVLDTQAEQANTASQEIAKAIQEIAEGAGTMTTNMGETNAEVETVAQRAKDAEERGTASLNAAREGGQSVEQTVAAMGKIHEAVQSTAQQIEDLGKRGEEIGDIVKTIEEIASQTNLLALNAAIEAARAGEQGRGFAVVADEVRKLAERTAVATKEIGTLIAGVQTSTGQAKQAMDASVENVAEGTTLAEQAGTALTEIVDGANAVSEQIAAIAEGSKRAGESVTAASAIAEESAASSEEVSASVEQVSAQVGEIARQSKELGELTANITSFIARFGKLAHDSEGQTFDIEKRAAA